MVNSEKTLPEEKYLPGPPSTITVEIFNKIW